MDHSPQSYIECPAFHGATQLGQKRHILGSRSGHCPSDPCMLDARYAAMPCAAHCCDGPYMNPRLSVGGTAEAEKAVPESSTRRVVRGHLRPRSSCWTSPNPNPKVNIFQQLLTLIQTLLGGPASLALPLCCCRPHIMLTYTTNMASPLSC